MRKMLRWRVLLPSSAVVAFVAAGVAVAGGGIGSVSQLSQTTFAATNVTHKDVRTCTGSDGTYEITHATFTGSATSSDPRLNGTVEIDAKSVINTSKNLGTVQGHYDVNGSTAGNGAHGKFSAVFVSGNVSGLADGNLDSPHAKLLSVVAGTYSTTTGFALTLGSGTANNVGIAYDKGCDNGKNDDHGNKPDKPGDQHGNKHDD